MIIAQVLDTLETHYGKQKAIGPVDPYEMILYANCGYPANDLTCRKGFDALREQVGLEPKKILAASEQRLAGILRLGGTFPELRARRLKEIAELAGAMGDLGAVVKRPIAEAKKALKKYPTIGDPGAEKILLFSGVAPVPAVPSAFVHVMHRLGFGEETKNYAAGYRTAQQALEAGIPRSAAALLRAYLLIQRHGRELCKRTKPLCYSCPLVLECRFVKEQKRKSP
jgi:endonuclease III